jgi:effector-binding domain-containing protein
MKSFLVAGICLIILTSSCAPESDNGVTANMPDTTSVKQEKLHFNNDLTKYSNLGGLVGIYEVEPMLTISKTDSSNAESVPKKVSAAYHLLSRQAEKIGAVVLQPGQISYNNDASNFKFECLFLLREFPSKQPDSASIVLLEPGSMLLYNYYGSYDKLYTAYDKIRKYCTAAEMKITGPMREFYMNDPMSESDSSKWLTRIMVPVAANMAASTGSVPR